MWRAISIYTQINMRTTRKTFTVLCLLVICAVAQGQNSGNVQRSAFQWRCETGDTVLNFNPATTSILHFDSIPYAEDYTLIVVYKPVADTESTVWNLVFADSISRTLTTERIFSGRSSIHYADSHDGKAVIHTLRQSVSGEDSSYVQLTVGDGNLMVAEVQYYDRRLGNMALRRVQTALAVRYGITLGPVDYITHAGERIWQYRRDSSRYHHRIIGIGNDTIYNVRQFRSHSEMDGDIVTVATDSLTPGSYLLLGDDDAPLSFVPGDETIYGGNYEILSRTWRIKATRTDNNLFSLSFDTRGFALPADSLVLLVDNDIYLPSAITANAVEFNHIFFPTDSCLFTLAKGSYLWQITQSHGAKGATSCSDDGNVSMLHPIHNPSLVLYPNPTTEHYTLEVSGTKTVSISVYNLQGKVMETYSDSNRDKYVFEGSLPSGNVYYATVTTDNGSQTIKIVVK